MKKILQLMGIAALLASSGCARWSDHSRSGDLAHRQNDADAERASGVDHGEYPGDLHHGEKH